jgi:hypothetical protein
LVNLFQFQFQKILLQLFMQQHLPVLLTGYLFGCNDGQGRLQSPVADSSTVQSSFSLQTGRVVGTVVGGGVVGGGVVLGTVVGGGVVLGTVVGGGVVGGTVVGGGIVGVDSGDEPPPPPPAFAVALKTESGNI